MSFYLKSGTSLNSYFPAYETQNHVFDFLALGEKHVTINLTRNYNGQTNYIVFYTCDISSLIPYPTSNTAWENITNTCSNCIVYNKISSSFDFILYNIINTSYTNIKVDFFIVYVLGNNNHSEIITTTNYQDNNLDLTTYFPQYYYEQNILSSTSASNYSYNDVSIVNKHFLTTNYFLFSSKETTKTLAGLQNNLPILNSLQSVLYGTTTKPTGAKTTVSYTFYIKLNNQAFWINELALNNIAFYLDPSYNSIYTSNYSITGSSIKLNQYYPSCEFNYIGKTDKNREYFGTVTLIQGRNTTNYIVLLSINYNSDGTTGTYDPWGGQPTTVVVTSKTTTYFTWMMTKTDGDNWNGGIQSMVIYL